jgi:hypothetical protein
MPEVNAMPVSLSRPLTRSETRLLNEIADSCRDSERNCAEDYIHTGALAWRYVGWCREDGIQRSQAVKEVRLYLQARGLRNLDVSTFIKSHWLHQLCPAVAQVQVSVLKALVPLCRVRWDMPQFREGASLPSTQELLQDIEAKHLDAAKVRTRVARLVGCCDKVERRLGEAVSDYLDKASQQELAAALRRNRPLRQRLAEALRQLQAELGVNF